MPFRMEGSEKAGRASGILEMRSIKSLTRLWGPLIIFGGGVGLPICAITLFLKPSLAAGPVPSQARSVLILLRRIDASRCPIDLPYHRHPVLGYIARSANARPSTSGVLSRGNTDSAITTEPRTTAPRNCEFTSVDSVKPRHVGGAPRGRRYPTPRLGSAPLSSTTE